MDKESLKLIIEEKPSLADFWNSIFNSAKISSSGKGKTRYYDSKKSFAEQYKDAAYYGLPFPLTQDANQNKKMAMWYAQTLMEKPAYIHHESMVFAQNHPQIRDAIYSYRKLSTLYEIGTLFEEAAFAHLYTINRSSPTVRINDDLLTALNNTSLSNTKIPLSYFRLPYQNFYIDFSQNQTPIKFYDNTNIGQVKYSSTLDGVFCNSSTAMPDDKEYSTLLDSDICKPLLEKRIVVKGEPIHCLYFLFITNIDNKPHPYPFKLVFSESCDDADIFELFLLSMFGLESHELDMPISDGVEAFQHALSLIVNIVFYTHFNNKDKETYKNHNNLKIQIKRTKNPAKLKKLKDEIASTPPHSVYIGQLYSLENPTKADHCNSTHKNKPHLRRGHWRKVLIGKGKSEHKIIWIKPYFTGGTGNSTASTVKIQ